MNQKDRNGAHILTVVKEADIRNTYKTYKLTKKTAPDFGRSSAEVCLPTLGYRK